MATAPFSLYVDLPALASVSRTGSTVTVTTTAPHGISTGAYVQLEGATGTAGTSANGVYAITVTSGSAFTYTAAGSAGTATIGSAVASQDILNPLINYTGTAKEQAPYALPGSLSLSASGDGNASTMTMTVAQDDTPSGGPWWATVPDQARIRLYKKDTGTAPTDADLYFIGTISAITATLNGSGQGTLADIAIDDVNAILDKLVVIGREIGAVNPISEDGFVRTSGSTVTVTTASTHYYPIGQQVTISGVIGGGSNMNGTFSVATVPSSRSFTYASSGTNGTGDSWVTPATAALKGTSKQIVLLTFSSAHFLKSGETVFLRNFVGSTDKFTNQLNTSFSGSSVRVPSGTAIELTMATPLTNAQTVTTKGQVQGNARIVPVGASTAQQNFTITGGQSEDSAAQAALSRVNSFKDDDPAVQRLLNTASITNVTGAGSNSANSIGLTVPAGSLRSVLDAIVETYGGEDKKQRRYWIGLDRTLYYKLVDTSAKPTYANAPYKIITTGVQDPNTTTAAATLIPYSLSLANDYNTVKSGLFNISAETGTGVSKVQRYTDAGYTQRKGAPEFDAVVDYPTSARDAAGAVSRAAKAYFLEQHAPLQTITFTLRGAGTAAHNADGFSAGYYQTGASTFALQKRWEPGQWVSIVCAELGLSDLFRIEQVEWGLAPGSYFQEITITANRRSPNSLTNIVKRKR